MELRFITATKTNNVYDVSDFWTEIAPGVWVMVPGVFNEDYNFTADDAVSSLVVNNSDGSYRAMTHMLVPSLTKVYEITGYEYINSTQTRLILSEDPLIANWPTLKTKTLYVSRTNDTTLFKGVHDIENTSINYTPSLEPGMAGKTGKWVLLTYQPTAAALTLDFDQLSAVGVGGYEYYPLLADVIAKYPEVSTNHPNSIYYMDKLVDTGAGYYQCIYDGTNSRMKWVPFIDLGGPEAFTATTFTRIMSPGDIAVIHALVPLSSRINISGLGVTRPAPSFYNMIRVLDARIISLRVIDEIIIPGSSATYNNATSTWTITIPNLHMTDATATYYLGQMGSFQEDKALSFTPSTLDTDITSYEPFTEYTLSVYGNRYKLNRRMIDTSNLRIRYQYSATNINYLVYYEHPGNVLMQGSISSSGITASDKFAEYLLNNSTYNQIKMINNVGNVVQKVVMGGAASLMMGNPIGAVMGVASGLIGTGLNIANQRLQEQAMKDAPDTLKGENTDLIGSLNNIFGIYLIKRVPKTTYYDAMRYNYVLKGHPTMATTTVDALTAVNDAVYGFGSTKLIYGEFKENIVNKYITGVINDKVKDGVIFVL